MTAFPCAIVADDAVLRIVYAPEPFVGPGDIQHPAAAWTSWSDDDFAALCPGWSILPIIDQPPVTTEGQRVHRNGEEAWTVGTDAVRVTYTVVDPTAEEIAAAFEQRKANALAALADIRWQKETGGITLNGLKVATDDRSKLLILGKRTKAAADPSLTFQWKTPTGFITLTAEQIVAIADAVEAHVQACFDREAALVLEIEAAKNPEQLAAIELGQGWPSA